MDRGGLATQVDGASVQRALAEDGEVRNTTLDRSVGARLRRQVGEELTLLDSRPASEEGSCMDPARLRHAPHPLALESQNTCARPR
jgi:hypothetical protein